MPDFLNKLTDLIADARKAGATAADALLYESASLSVSRRMRQPEGLERSESRGISLRVFSGTQSATVSSSDTGKDALRELVTRGVAMARLAPEDPHATLAPEELLARTLPELDLYDAREPEAEWLQEQCRIAEDAALAIKGITNSEGGGRLHRRLPFRPCHKRRIRTVLSHQPVFHLRLGAGGRGHRHGARL